MTLGPAVLLTASGRAFAPAVLVPNPNSASAGRLSNGVLSVDLDVTTARWNPEATHLAMSDVVAFAERGKPPSIPAPLVRAPAGTEVHFSIRNTLDRPITFFAPRSATVDDSIVVDPKATGDLRATLDKSGNFIYRATIGDYAGKKFRVSGVLAGAVIVDSIGATKRPDERVLVILQTPDSEAVALGERGARAPLGTPLFGFTINGRSWPKTERVSATVGDTLHWRVINASFDIHPMHLHGFFYDVDQFDGREAARNGEAKPDGPVVTQRLSGFSGMTMTWVAERPGQWLFHCHFAVHLEPPPGTVEHSPTENHALAGMVGLVIGIDVKPSGRPRVTASLPSLHSLRLIAVRDSGYPDSVPSLRFIIDDHGRRTQAWPGMSPTLYLRRNEPVAITVVNTMPEPTAVHWHGIELDSYNDGVAGWSGMGTRVAPLIAPGDSFVARFTPTRSGTFMYHSHYDDPRQQPAGLAGALIVRDGPGPVDADDHVFFLKGARAGPFPPRTLDINGQTDPDTVVFHVGRAQRLRLLSLALVNPNATVWLTTRMDSAFSITRDTMVVDWRPVAKDGADLPENGRSSRLARQMIAPGEAYDFSYTPSRTGRMRLEVRSTTGVLLARVPIKVE